MNDDIQSEIMQLERELRDLKTAQGLLPSIKTFSANYTFTGTGQEQLNRIIELEYEAGDDVVFSGCTTATAIGILDLVGNKQQFFFRIITTGTAITFYANREIKSVTLL